MDLHALKPSDIFSPSWENMYFSLNSMANVIWVRFIPSQRPSAPQFIVSAVYKILEVTEDYIIL